MKFTKLLPLLFLPLVIPSPAHALSCLPPPEPEQAFQDADAVFLAEAMSVSNQGHTVELQVIEQYKPEQPISTPLTITTDETWGLTFEPNQQYLLYASHSEDSSQELTVPLCTRSHFGGDLSEDIPVITQLASTISTESATPTSDRPEQPIVALPPESIYTRNLVWIVSLAITVLGIAFAAYHLRKMNSPKS